MRAIPSSRYSQAYLGEEQKTALALSLKATERRRTIDDDPIAGLKRAQEDYKAARSGYRNRQRRILEDVYRCVSDLLDDDEACDRFLKRAKFAGRDADDETDARGDIWFHALAYVYEAKSKESRKRASKHAAALRLLSAEDVEADQIAATIKKRGGIQKLANEAAKPGRKGAKKRADQDDTEARAKSCEASDDDGAQGTDEDDAEPKADNGEGNDDAEQAEVEEAADADQKGVRFRISEKLTEKIRKCRGKRLKIIARVPRKMNAEIKELTEGKKEMYFEAKGTGFDVKTVREVIRIRKQDQKQREEQESLVDLYLQAIKGAARASKAA